MKKLLMDLHTHTLSSGHAFSTLKENIEAGVSAGLRVFGTSDHSVEMPGTCTKTFFENYKCLPKEIDGMRVLGGIEANIINYHGDIDVTARVMKNLDYCIASLHPPCIAPGTEKENTHALICAMQNEEIKIIGHPDDGRYPLDYDAVVREAVATRTALELNNSSLNPQTGRTNTIENNRILLKTCMKYGARIIVGTDSHICYEVGNFDRAVKLLEEMHFPEELIINTDVENLKLVLNR